MLVMKLLFPTVALLTSIAFPMQAKAEQAASQTAPQGAQGSWQVDGGDDYCSLVRSSGGPAPTVFALKQMPGSGMTTLLLALPQTIEGAPTAGTELDVVLQPTGRRLKAVVRQTYLSPSRRFMIELVSTRSLLEDFPRSNSIEVQHGPVRLFQLSYPTPAQPIALVGECENDALREWGVDPAVLAGLQSRPSLVSGEITHEDYPPDAISAGQQGTVVSRIIVDAAGVPSACKVVESSGSPSLDARSCAVIQERFRFAPAVAANGQAVRAPFVHTTRWSIDN